jgi:phosphoglycolate phosphatase-like HAD superfamily hydrolase/ADP-ribose pyrophosphatase YjhB (NUDIX family)
MNVVFDWAGTLADDQALTWRLTDRVLRMFGGEGVTFQGYKDHFTFPVGRFYRTRLPEADLDAVEEAFRALCRAEYPGAAPLFPGVKEGLACLACKHSLYLLTSLDHAMVEEALAVLGIRGHFRAVQGSIKDKAAFLPGWMESLGLSKDETIAFGDMPHDLDAARAASVHGVAVTYGYGGREALVARGPETLAEDFAAVMRILDKAACAEARHFPVATVGGLIRDDDGRMLLVRTRKWSGLYGIPGGKIDYGETMEAAFVRETREETGLTVTGLEFAMVQDCVEHPQFYRPRHFILVNYLARAAGSRPAVRLNHEGDHFLWATPGEAFDLPLNGPTRVLLERVYGKAAP